MLRRPPGSTRTDTLFPYTTLFRAVLRSIRQIYRRNEMVDFAKLRSITPAERAIADEELRNAEIIAERNERAALSKTTINFTLAEDAELRSTMAGAKIEIGRAHVRTPVTNAHPECRLILEKKITTKKVQDN